MSTAAAENQAFQVAFSEMDIGNTDTLPEYKDLETLLMEIEDDVLDPLPSITQYTELEDDPMNIEPGLLPLSCSVTHYTEPEDDLTNIEPDPVPLPFSVTQYTEPGDDLINIEPGPVPLPLTCSITPLSTTDCNSSETGQLDTQKKKRRRHWTIHEHKLLLFGLKKHGTGDWKGIARNVVTSRTPAQVASHAQKYFNRKIYNGNVKRRASIHDITELSPEEEAFIESDLILDSLVN